MKTKSLCKKHKCTSGILPLSDTPAPLIQTRYWHVIIFEREKCKKVNIWVIFAKKDTTKSCYFYYRPWQSYHPHMLVCASHLKCIHKLSTILTSWEDVAFINKT